MLIHMADVITTVTRLAAEHPLAPAGLIEASSHQVTIRLHNGLADFEAWREALGITPDDVHLATYTGGANLRAATRIGATTVVVIGTTDYLHQRAHLEAA